MGHDGHDHEHEHHQHPHEEHRRSAPASVSAWVITCSDTRNGANDRGGPMIRHLLEHAGHTVTGTSLVRDLPDEIRHAMEQARDSGARAIMLTGGTGLASRDVTVETVTPMFQRRIDGFGELFRMLSFQQVGSAAMLTRATAGVWNGVVVFALPGSPEGARLAMEKLVLPELGHLVREISR
jgi:molybdenum cofactor biosynthesis protein B